MYEILGFDDYITTTPEDLYAVGHGPYVRTHIKPMDPVIRDRKLASLEAKLAPIFDNCMCEVEVSIAILENETLVRKYARLMGSTFDLFVTELFNTCGVKS